MMRFLAGVVMVVGAVAFMGSTALAQEGGGDSVVFKKKTIIDFSDVLIEGELTKPEGSYVVSRKLSRFSTLIQLRQDFKFELLNSPNDL